MKNTAGQFTTGKLQLLLDIAHTPGIASRRELAAALADAGEQISIHGVEAWFRHVDSNYNLKRESLSDESASYPVPKRRWPTLLRIFRLQPDDLNRTDSEFQRWCLDAKRARKPSSSDAGVLSKDNAPIGQEAVWRQLHDARERAVTGHPTLLTLAGAAGVGKTHLLDSLHHADTAADTIHLRAVCAEHTQLPLIPIIDMFRNCREALLAADERLARQFNNVYEAYVESTPTGFESPQTFLDLVTVVSGMCRRQLVVLLLDDLHLADDATARFVDYLWTHARAQSDLKLLIVAGYRPSETRSQACRLIESLENMTSTQTIELQPLGQESLKAMLDARLDWPLTRDAFSHIWQHSFGLPAQALELLNLYRSSDGLFARNGFTEIQAELLIGDDPTELRAIYRNILNTLSDETHQLLSLAACLGIGFDLKTLQKLKPDWSLETILDAISEAEQLGLLAHNRDKFQFRNAAIASALYRSESDTRRARLHLEISQMLQARGALTEYQIVEAAHHMRLAGPLADAEPLADLCRRAAFSAARLAAWPQVIQFSDSVLNTSSADLALADRGQLLRLVASAWHQSGNPDVAIHNLLAAMDVFRESGDEIEYLRTLNELVRIRGNFGRSTQDGNADIQELLSLSEKLENTDPRLASRVFDAIAGRMTLQGDGEAALKYALKARDAVIGHPPSTELGLASIAVAVGYLQQHRLQEARDQLEDAYATALQINDQHTANRALQRLTIPLLVQGRLDDVESTLSRIQALDDPMVHTGEISIPLSSMISACALRGRFEEAESFYQKTRNIIDSTGYFWAEANALSAYACSLSGQGKLTEALSLINSLLNVSSESREGRGRGGLSRLRTLLTIKHAPDEFPTDSGYKYAKAPGRFFDVNSLSRYCVDTEVALAAGDQPALASCHANLQQAFERGARFSLGWPMCLPHLMARTLIRLDAPQDAHYYLTIAHQLCRELHISGELAEINQTFAEHFPVDARPRVSSPPAASDPAGTPHLTLIKNTPSS